MKTILNLVDDGHLWEFHGGIHPPSRKARTKDCKITELALPEKLYLPLSQHAGQPALPVVSIGSDITQGQLLARKEGFISANVVASASGKITDIKALAACHPSGIPTSTMVIETSAQQQALALAPLSLTDEPQAIINRISDCGITGLGGASFPTAVKLSPSKPIEYLIINAAECEPYITSDDVLMRERATDIINGIKVMQKLLSPVRTIIAIEDNKPEAIASIQTAVDESMIVRAIPTLYPAGGEKQLIEVLTSQQVPSGKIPADIGVVVQNIATSYAAGNAVLKGQPLVSRIVTVTGDLVSKPGNYEVPLGMSIKEMLTQCGFTPSKNSKIIVGGPMMGFALNDINAPVLKATNCVIAASEHELPNPPAELNCIRCGDCESVCPAQLLPQQLQWFAKDKDHDKLREHDLFDCIECGACAYVCPSHIPLVQYYRVAKAEIRSEDAEKAQAQRAKERFEARTARLERDKAEREERNRLAAQKRREAMKSNNDGDAVAAALARVKAKKAQPAGDAPANDRVAAEIARAKAKKAAANGDAKPVVASDSQPQQDEKKSRVADAIARAKAKKLAAQQAKDTDTEQNSPKASNDKQARVAAAVAKAKAKKLAQQQTNDDTDIGEAGQQAPSESEKSAVPTTEQQTPAPATDDKKARIAAAVAKAKAKKLAQQQTNDDSDTDEVGEQVLSEQAESAEPATEQQTPAPATDDKKARIAAAVAKAKAKKLAQQQTNDDSDTDETSQQAPSESEESAVPATEQQTPAPATDDKKARIAAAVAKAKAKKQAQQQTNDNSDTDEVGEQVLSEQAESAETAAEQPSAVDSQSTQKDDKAALIARAVAKAKANALAKKNLENKDN